MKQSSGGFTLVEVLVAIVVLAIGLLALVSTSGITTRMIGRGKMETRAVEAASGRMERLRLAAYASTPRCTAPEFATGGPVVSQGVTASWTVPPAGSVRPVRVTVTYLTVHGSRTATLETVIEC
jgi:prepilin-type N-terminal cleavage/methylation domain-containing protein